MDIRVFVEPQQGASYEDQACFARATEAAGLDGFFRSDHFVAMGDHYQRGVGPTDAWVTLGAIARETTRIRLGTLLSAATFRLPGPLAVTVAQVDEMSGGRVEFGLGAAWFEREHLAYGIPFGSSFSERLDRLEEQLEIITEMWSTPIDQHFSYAGRHYELVDSPALPKPTQAHVPIIVGGKGPRRTPMLAARFADELNLPFPTPEIVATSFAALERACEAIGRDVATVHRSVALTTIIGENEVEAARRAKSIGRELDELREDGLAGTPDEIASKLEVLAAHGVDRVYLQLLDLSDLAQLELIGAALRPLIADL
jgi:F420-dependent oxidoreductase-like protein